MTDNPSNLIFVLHIFCITNQLIEKYLFIFIPFAPAVSKIVGVPVLTRYTSDLSRLKSETQFLMETDSIDALYHNV